MKPLKFITALGFFILMSGINISVSAQQTKIVTGHPDFKIKITRCEASGTTAVIDMLIENVGSRDVPITIYGGRDCSGTPRNMSVAYDDEGNKYTGDNDFRVSIGKSDFSRFFGVDEVLPPDIPMKVRIQLEGVPESATELKRIDLIIYSSTWGLNDKKPIKITNVPIYREGDE